MPDRRARIDAFLDAYGIPADFDVADAVIRHRHATIEHVRLLADQGVEPQRTWVAEGSLEDEAAEIRWIEGNRALLAVSPAIPPTPRYAARSRRTAG
ncbi:hypothetical protein EXE59_11080 [Nocardioides eburneiflavus]|uniref:Uncharacterized protein n=1 Tax=Nocardioides eburneiflavus TaxID=2518372 RepID=A0A4Z1CEN0_9ACTN|nr:hypothetical protein [Nocardioides eburneiflavus]TGN64445.1 hypothetical protein EXE59_11080 [Nocardioides eburneiflavus]